MILVKQMNEYRLYLDITSQAHGMYMLRFLRSNQLDAEPEETSRIFLYANELQNVISYIQQSLTKGKQTNEN